MDMQALAEALDDLEFAQDLPWTYAEIKAEVQAKHQEALQILHSVNNQFTYLFGEYGSVNPGVKGKSSNP